MKKVVGQILVLVALLLTASCGTDKPWVGEWIPESGNQDGVIELKSDGTAIYDQQSSDGSVYIEGSWTEVEGQPNQIKIKFDEATIEADADNPLVEILLSQVGEALCSQTLEASVSENGDYLKCKDGNRGYIRK